MHFFPLFNHVDRKTDKKRELVWERMTCYMIMTNDGRSLDNVCGSKKLATGHGHRSEVSWVMDRCEGGKKDDGFDDCI